MDREYLDRLMADDCRGKSEGWLREYLADVQKKVEVEQERLQCLAGVDFHVREVERQRQKVVELQAKKASERAARAAGATAEKLQEWDWCIESAQICFACAEAALASVRREPAAYA
jgi:hypothetical protein